MDWKFSIVSRDGKSRGFNTAAEGANEGRRSLVESEDWEKDGEMGKADKGRGIMARGGVRIDPCKYQAHLRQHL